MDVTLAFGCPECGRRIDLDRKSSGRRVRCGRCGTLVEVPFFPRQFGRRRSRRPRWRAWATVGLLASAAVVVPAGAWSWWQASIRSGQAEALGRAMAALDEAERGGDLASAVLAADEARALASRLGIEPPGGPDALASRRDGLARREAESRLAALAALPPDRAAEAARSLLDRVAADPALSPIAREAAEEAGRVAGRWADHQLSQAEAARDAGRPAEALAVAERLAAGLDHFPDAVAAGARGRVRAFAAALVERGGARVGPIGAPPGPGPGEAPAFEDELSPILAEALARRGYVVVGPDSPLAGLCGQAPFALRATIVEQQGPPYLQSPNRTTCFAVDLALDRDGRAVWSEHFDARTRIPLPGLSALESSRIALASRPSADLSRRFSRDARLDLVDKLRLKLSALPPPPGGPPDPP